MVICLIGLMRKERKTNIGSDKIYLNSRDCLFSGLHLDKCLLARISIPEKSPHLIMPILSLVQEKKKVRETLALITMFKSVILSK